MPSPHLIFPKVNRIRRAGFSLVEVVLAIGVMAFAFVGIFALLPAGLTSFKQAMDTSVCSQIAQRIMAEAQQTDFSVLIDEKNLPANPDDRDDLTFRAPTKSSPALRYFDDQGNEIVPKTPAILSAEEKQKIVYHVNVRITVQTALPSATGREAPHVATLTVQVASNPANKEIKIDASTPDDESKPNRNLFVTTPGVSILTYAAHVGRNQ